MGALIRIFILFFIPIFSRMMLPAMKKKWQERRARKHAAALTPDSPAEK